MFSRRVVVSALLAAWVFCCIAVGFMLEERTLLFYFLSLFGLVLIYFFGGLNIIKEWVRRPTMLFGNYYKAYGPTSLLGLAWIEPLFLTQLPDRSIQDIVYPPFLIEQLITADKIAIIVEIQITACIDRNNIRDNVVNVEDPQRALLARGEAAARENIGKSNNDHVQHEREKFAAEVKADLEKKVAGWGFIIKAIEVTRTEYADPLVAKAFAEQALATAAAKAQLIRARVQEAVATLLNTAAAVYTDRGWQLKQIEVVEDIARNGQNNTIAIAPEILSALSKQLPAVLQLPQVIETKDQPPT